MLANTIGCDNLLIRCGYGYIHKNKAKGKEMKVQLIAGALFLSLIAGGGLTYCNSEYYQRTSAVKNVQADMADIIEEYGRESPRLVPHLLKLAEAYRQQGNAELAEPELDKALWIAEKYDKYNLQQKERVLIQLVRLYPEIKERNIPQITQTIALAELLWGQQRFSDADQYFQQALGILSRIDNYEPKLIPALNRLAKYSYQRENYPQAEFLYRKAIEISERQEGADSYNVVKNMLELAVLYMKLERYEQAEKMYRRGLDLKIKQMGDSHYEVTEVLINLAILYQRQKRYDQAENYYRRALVIRMKTLGANDNDTASVLYMIGWLYQLQHKYDQAQQLYLRALNIKEKEIGAFHKDIEIVLKNLLQVNAKLPNTDPELVTKLRAKLDKYNRYHAQQR